MREVPRYTGAGAVGLLLALLPLLGSAATGNLWETLPEPPPLLKPVKSGFSPVGDIRMFYAVFGEGEPVLLLHGRRSPTATTSWLQTSSPCSTI